MRVLLQNRKDAFDVWGGDTTQMIETANALHALGVETEVSLDQSPSTSGFDLVHVFNIQRADYSLPQVLNAKRRGIPVALSTIFWDARPVLSSNEYYKYLPNPSVRYLSRVSDTLVRWYMNTRTSPRRWLINKNARRMLMEADVLFPNSFAEIEHLALTYRLSEVRAKSLVVPNAVRVNEEIIESPELSQIGLPDEYVLEAAAFYPVKGQLALIEALMEDREIPLVLVGGGVEGIYGEKCRRLAKERANTLVLGHVPHEKLGWFYSKAKVHALPSLRESPGLSTLEAAVHSANCVVSIHGPIGEYFGDDVWVCDPENPASIRKAVLDAWSAPHTDHLKQQIQKYFTWEEAARITLQGYERVLQAK
jgi:glycosyltransferase involved in cell wall biosynthesis